MKLNKNRSKGFNRFRRYGVDTKCRVNHMTLKRDLEIKFAQSVIGSAN